MSDAQNAVRKHGRDGIPRRLKSNQMNDTNRSAGKRRLLMVEDDPIIGAVCLRILDRSGFDVTLASDGRVALKLLGENTFDICLCDVRTPAINGIELYGCICESFNYLSQHVVFMTGDVLSQNIHEFTRKNGCQLLHKPFTTDDLMTAVNSSGLNS